MLTPSNDIIQLLQAFAPRFTKPTFAKVLLLLYGTILAPGKRTVTAALRVLGLDQEANFGKFHRVLNQAPWSAMALSRTLLGLLMQTFVPAGTGLVLLVDETLERRAGKKIVYKGWFRDAVRSVGNKVAVTLGIRWCVLCLLVPVPWASRPWALPFLAVPVLSEKVCARLKRPHRSAVGWTMVLLAKVRSWYPDRQITVVGDGGFASVELVACCQRLGICLVSRLRVDAQLYAFPAPQPPSKRGPKPQKGERLRCLERLLADPKTIWCQVGVPWYGEREQIVGYRTGVCLWHTQGQAPVPIRWVLVRYEVTHAKTGKVSVRTAVLLSSEVTMAPEAILGFYVARWNIEVTFEEVRAHLGLETQRHWSRRAIGRTTPCLLGVFSLVVLMAQRLHPKRLPVQDCAWYVKEEATFSDVLGAVRSHLWGAMNYANSSFELELCLIPRPVLRRLEQLACYAA
jgi:hypothetical protein